MSRTSKRRRFDVPSRLLSNGSVIFSRRTSRWACRELVLTLSGDILQSCAWPEVCIIQNAMIVVSHFCCMPDL